MEERSIFCKNNFIKIRYFHFDIPKAVVLRCKTYAFIVQTTAFGTRNNRFHNVLINMKLNNSYACEKDLQLSSLFLTYNLLLFYSYVVFYMKSPTYW